MRRTNTVPFVLPLILTLLFLFFSCSVDDIAEPNGEENIWEKIHGPRVGSTEAIVADVDGKIFASVYYGVIRSTDGGNAWDDLDVGLPTTTPRCLAVGAPGAVYVGASSGVFVSDDGGDSWTNLTGDRWKWRIYELDTNETGTILAAGASTDVSDYYYIGCSHDNGETWTRCYPDTAVHWYRAVFIAPDGDLFAGTHGGDLFRSQDGGAEWTRIGEDVLSGAILHITEGPSGELLACGAGGVFRSADGGAAWEAVTGSGEPGSVVQMAFGPDGSFYACSVEGVYRSTDGGETWEKTITGMHNSNARALIALPGGALFCGTVRGSIFRSTDAGATWSQVNETGLDPDHIAAVALDAGGSIYAGTYSLGLFRSLDGGSTWLNFDMGPPGNSVYDLAVSGGGHIFAATGSIIDSKDHPVYGGVYRSTDGGWSWNHCGLDHSTVSHICIAPNRDIYASTHSGLYRSGNDGDTWEEIDIGRQTTFSIRDIAITGSGHIYITVYTEILRSTDGGNTWERLLGGLEEYGDQYYALAATESGYIFAASADGGIYRSTDRGESWRRVYGRGGVHPALSISTGPGGVVVGGSQGNFIIFSGDGGDTWQEIHIPGYISSGYYADNLCFDESGRLLVTVSRQILLRSTIPVL